MSNGDEGTSFIEKVGDVAGRVGNVASKAVDPLGASAFIAKVAGVPPLQSPVKPALDDKPPPPAPPSKVAQALSGLQDEPARDPGAFGAPGGGAGGVSGSVEYTAGPPIPKHLIDKQMALGYMHADLVSASQQARADAAHIAIDLNTELAEGYRSNFEKTKNQVDSLLMEAELEKDAIGELIEAAKSNRINPGQFFANVGEAGKFSAALAVGAGAMATAFGGGPNVAYQIVQSAIDRNVRAQVINMQHGRALIAHQTNFVNTIRGLSNDRAQYGNYVQLGLTAIAQAEFGKVQATLAQTDALLAARDVYIRLGAAIVDSQIRAITNSQARVTLKFKGMAQRMQALRIAGAVPQRKTGAAPASTRGKKPEPGPSIPDKAIDTALNAKGGVFADNLANSFVQQILSTPRGTRKIEQKDEMVARIDEVLDQLDSTDPHYADLVAAKNKIEDIPDNLIGNRETTTIAVRGYGNKIFPIVEPDRFKKEGKAGVTNALNTLSMLDSVHSLMDGTSASPNVAFLRELGIADGKRNMSTFSSVEQARLIAKMKNLNTRLTYGAFMSMNEDARNAMNRSFEVRMGQAVAGTGVSVAEFFADYYRNDPALRKARVLPAIDEAMVNVQSAVHNAGLWMEPFEK